MSYLVGRPQRLSESLLWDLQLAYYDRKGTSCWEAAEVPSFVTSNAFIAKLYASSILAFAKDISAKARCHDGNTGSFDDSDTCEKYTINILELGSGHGMLGYLIAKQLLALRKFWPPVPTRSTMKDESKPAEGSSTYRFRVILTDFTESNVNVWRRMSVFKELVEAGVVDFAVVDAEDVQAVKLVEKKLVLSSSTLHTPLVCLANYLYDTMKQDAFQVSQGQLKDGYCILRSDRKEKDPKDPDLIKRMSLEWAYKPCSPQSYYQHDDVLNHILQEYIDQSEHDLSFLMPIGALKSLRSLNRFSNGNLLLLVGDKGFTHLYELQGSRNPHIAIHGSFSFMTNFHAMSAYVNSLGGFSLMEDMIGGFKCVAFVLGMASRDCPELELHYQNGVNIFSAEHFISVQRAITAEEQSQSAFNKYLALLRLANYDALIFARMKDYFLENAPLLSEWQKHNLSAAIGKVMDQHYPLQKDLNISLEAGKLLFKIGEIDFARQCFQKGEELYGPNWEFSLYQALCAEAQDAYGTALSLFQKSSALGDPTRKSSQGIEKMKQKILTSTNIMLK